uniref:SMP domain-containing protein n=1 Tax=Leersia perrieri TaxID=77586 RepID=A0A0D9X8V6_9ORYZ
MASKLVVSCTCILIFIVVIISGSQAEARRLTAVTPTTTAVMGNEPFNEDAVVVEGDGSFRAVQEMASSASTDAVVAEESKPMATTDARPTAPGNSPGIGNKGRINN